MKIIEILATLLTIAGFFAVSEGWFVVGFAMSLAGQILWFAWAYDSKAWGIMVVNACLAVSSINGLVG